MAKQSFFIRAAKAINPMNIYHFWNVTVHHFGFKFSLLLVSNYFGIKGALKEFAQGLELPLYREGGWDASVKQKNSAVSQLPNAMKGFAGALSDLMPIFGYEKGSYMVIYTIISALCIMGLMFVDFEKGVTSDKIPAMLFFGIFAQSAFLDIFMEGKYADLMNKSPGSRATAITFSYFMITVGAILPGFTVGTLSDVIPVKYIFIIPLPLAVQPIFFIFAGCMVDDKAAPHRNNRFDYVKARQESSILILTVTVAVLSLISAFIGLFGTSFAQFVYSLCASVFVALLAYYFLPIMVAGVNVYVYLTQTLYLDLSGPLEYFYTGDELCVPGGPHFSYTYYKTWVVVVGVLAQLAGIWLFQSVVSYWRYRPIFWITTCVRCIASLFDIVIINRWNIALGVPDKLAFMLGNTIIYQVCFMIDFLPVTLIIAKVCPKNIETSLFAILAGYGNFGQAAGKFVGNYLVESYDIVLLAKGPGCNYDNLVWVILISHLFLPMIQVPLTFVLLPNNKVDENIADATFENPRYLFRKSREQSYEERMKNTIEA